MGQARANGTHAVDAGKDRPVIAVDLLKGCIQRANLLDWLNTDGSKGNDLGSLSRQQRRQIRRLRCWPRDEHPLAIQPRSGC
jgi:hypothetical protein